MLRPESVEEISGKGICAVIEEKEVLCGNKALLELHHVNLSEYQNTEYGTEVLVAVNHKLIGNLLVADAVKPEAKNAIATLKKQGLQTVMLTGDTENVAKKVADDTGVEHVYAKLLPDEKLEKMKEAREKFGAAMFVGD